MASPQTKSGILQRSSRIETLLPAAAFILLATSFLARTPLRESLTVSPADLFGESPMWWASSPAVTWTLHIVAGLGVLLTGLWLASTRRKWRCTGLVAASGLMILAGLIAAGVTSDKRLAINAAASTIIPLIASGALYQLLVASGQRRRALLASLVAISAANCYRGTAQYFWEYRQTWEYYQQNKERYWRVRGLSPDAPEVKIYESRLRARQPSGYFYHPNAMASFLLLGLAGCAAACGRTRSSDQDNARDRSRHQTKNKPRRTADRARVRKGSIRRERRPEADDLIGSRSVDIYKILIMAALPCLLMVLAWHLLNLVWIGSIGSWLGLGCGGLVGLVLWLFRQRPGRAGLLCAAMVAGLQTVVVALALGHSGYLPWLLKAPKGKSLQVRLHYWQGAARLFAEHPLAGVGPGQFGKQYVQVKPAVAAEEVTHPHNWLLAIAAEWGSVGLVGLLLAWIGPGWRLFRGLKHEPADAAHASDRHTLWLSVATVLGCWLILLISVVPVGLPVVLYEAIPAMPLALLVAYLVGLSVREDQISKAALISGLVAFFVHGMVGIGPNVLGAVFPFWAVLALAMAWGEKPDGEEMFPRRRSAVAVLRPVVLVLGSAAVLLVITWLAYRPIRAAWYVNQARVDYAKRQFRQTAQALLAAADADPLDPLPFKALGLFHQHRARQLSSDVTTYRQAIVNHLRGAVGTYEQACRLDRLDAGTWRDLAMASRSLAQQTRDPREANRAMAAMEQSIRLYPNRPGGHLEMADILASFAAVLNRRDLLQRAIEELKLALQLDEEWPKDDPRKLSSRQRSEIRLRIGHISEWLQSRQD